MIMFVCVHVCAFMCVTKINILVAIYCISKYIYFYHNEAIHQRIVLYDNYNTTV